MCRLGHTPNVSYLGVRLKFFFFLAVGARFELSRVPVGRRTPRHALCPSLLGLRALLDCSRPLFLCFPGRRQNLGRQEDGWCEGRDGCDTHGSSDVRAFNGQLFSHHGVSHRGRHFMVFCSHSLYLSYPQIFSEISILKPVGCSFYH